LFDCSSIPQGEHLKIKRGMGTVIMFILFRGSAYLSSEQTNSPMPPVYNKRHGTHLLITLLD